MDYKIVVEIKRASVLELIEVVFDIPRTDLNSAYYWQRLPFTTTGHLYFNKIS